MTPSLESCKKHFRGVNAIEANYNLSGQYCALMQWCLVEQSHLSSYRNRLLENIDRFEQGADYDGLPHEEEVGDARHLNCRPMCLEKSRQRFRGFVEALEAVMRQREMLIQLIEQKEAAVSRMNSGLRECGQTAMTNDTESSLHPENCVSSSPMSMSSDDIHSLTSENEVKCQSVCDSNVSGGECVIRDTNVSGPATHLSRQKTSLAKDSDSLTASSSNTQRTRIGEDDRWSQRKHSEQSLEIDKPVVPRRWFSPLLELLPESFPDC